MRISSAIASRDKWAHRIFVCAALAGFVAAICPARRGICQDQPMPGGVRIFITDNGSGTNPVQALDDGTPLSVGLTCLPNEPLYKREVQDNIYPTTVTWTIGASQGLLPN